MKHSNNISIMWQKTLYVLMICGLCFACQSDNQAGDAGASQTPAAESGYTPGPGSVVGPPQLPPQNPTTAKLMKDYWVFEFYVVPGDRAASRAGQGRWYKFNPDGTFESGRWDDEKWGSGNWYYQERDGKRYLRLDSSVDAEDAEWDLQGATEDAMSWSGTATYDQGGIILKALNLMTIPTREQFGYE